MSFVIWSKLWKPASAWRRARAPGRQARGSRRAARRLCVERLEDRTLLSAGTGPIDQAASTLIAATPLSLVNADSHALSLSPAGFLLPLLAQVPGALEPPPRDALEGAGPEASRLAEGAHAHPHPLDSADERGSSSLTGQPIQVNGTGLTSSIARAGEVDSFRFTAPITGRLTVQLSVPPEENLDGTLRLFDGAQRLIVSRDTDSGTNAVVVQLNVAAGQTYYIQVAGSGAGTGRYNLFFFIAVGNPVFLGLAGSDLLPPSRPILLTEQVVLTNRVKVPRQTISFVAKQVPYPTFTPLLVHAGRETETTQAKANAGEPAPAPMDVEMEESGEPTPPERQVRPPESSGDAETDPKGTAAVPQQVAARMPVVVQQMGETWQLLVGASYHSLQMPLGLLNTALEPFGWREMQVPDLYWQDLADGPVEAGRVPWKRGEGPVHFRLRGEDADFPAPPPARHDVWDPEEAEPPGPLAAFLLTAGACQAYWNSWNPGERGFRRRPRLGRYLKSA